MEISPELGCRVVGGRWLGEDILVFLSKAKKFKLQRSDLRFGEAECVKEIEIVLGRWAICHASPFLLSAYVTSCSPLSSLVPCSSTEGAGAAAGTLS